MNGKKIVIVFLLCCVLFLLCYYGYYAVSDKTVETDTKKGFEGGVVIDKQDSFDEFAETVVNLIACYDSKDITGKAKNQPYYSKRLIVQGLSGSQPDMSGFGAEAVICGPNQKYILQFDSVEGAEEAHEKIGKAEGVCYCDPDRYFHITSESDNPVSWGKEVTGAGAYAEQIADIDRSVTVAVVDSGVYKHSFLKERIVEDGRNFVQYGSKPDDDNSHGTHVAGIIAGCTPGLNVNILPVKVLNKGGHGSSIQVALGIEYAAQHADVINLSLGGDYDRTIDLAVEMAIKQGCTVVAAAGNENDDTSMYSPAHLDECIVVSGIDNQRQRYQKSNYGKSVDVTAPAVDVESCVPVFSWFGKDSTDGKGKGTGTSQAAPHISALAAMLLIEYPDTAPDKLEQMIKDCSIDIGPEGRDKYFGWGVPDLRNGYQKKLWNVGVFSKYYYDGILEEYCTAAESKFTSCTNFINEGVCNIMRDYKFSLYYDIIDLADDGVPELIISFASEANDNVKMILDIYGVRDGFPNRMISSDSSVGYRTQYYICKDKRIKCSGSGGALNSETSYYRVESGSGELTLEETYIYDGWNGSDKYTRVDSSGNRTEISEKDYREHYDTKTDIYNNDWSIFYGDSSPEQTDLHKKPQKEVITKLQSPVLNDWCWKESKHQTCDVETYEITWNKAAGAQGYEVEFSSNDEGEWYTNVVQTNETAFSESRSSLPGILKVRVRAYTVADGQTVYSDWSQEKTVNIEDLWNYSEPLYRE